MDLLFKIIFYGILALIPISFILILALDKKSKLRQELVENAQQERKYSYNSGEDAKKVCDQLFNDPMTDPAQSYLFYNIFHDDKKL